MSVHYGEHSSVHSLGRRIIARLHPARYTSDGAYRDSIGELVARGIGGFCIFDGTLDDVSETIGRLQSLAQHPLLFAIDAETGLRMRIEDAVEFPHAFALGMQDPSVTEGVASAIAQSLRSLGIAWNFAPCADIASNPHNPIIGIRAFAAEAPRVVEHVRAWIRGHQREGVAACAKHFPGHGDASTDSHIELPIIAADADALVARELVPFYAAIKESVRSVMVGHLAVPALDASGQIASLSEVIVRGLLRERLGYGGIIVTDALDMHPITQHLPSGRAVTAAFVAGCDVALVPADAHEAIEGAEHAFRSGMLSAEEHREALARIDRLVKDFAAVPRTSVSLSDHAQRALEAAAGALRLAGDRSVLPLTQYAQIAAFALVEPESPLDAPTEFFRYLAQLYDGNMDVAFISRDIEQSDVAAHAEAIARAECIVIAVFERPCAGHPHVRWDDGNVTDALERLAEGKRRVLLLAGTPTIELAWRSDAVLWTFSDSSPSCAAAALLLSGRIGDDQGD